ncbi:hypothetical protein F5Y12DRAFT_460575 [Xylaria sp. FL1777]|nr:hypothetical protein F5Y12DRAFT_460575 [Xylaria sp. FL1777]
MTTLPSLTDEPSRHPGCCFSLSQPLLATIRSLLPPIPTITPPTDLHERKSCDEYKSAPELERALILSIGSGTGLLEELLHTYLNDNDDGAHSPIGQGNLPQPFSHPGASGLPENWRVEGVEVNQAVNVYLPEDRINHVAGTWAVLESRARVSTVLMFVYPRDGGLVRRYIDVFMKSPPSAGDNGWRGGDQQGGGRENEDVTASDSGNERERKSEHTRTNESVKKFENINKSTADDIWSTSACGAQLVLWLGPKCDWEDTGLGSCNANGEYEISEIRVGVGLVDYEMLATLRRKTAPSN